MNLIDIKAYYGVFVKGFKMDAEPEQVEETKEAMEVTEVPSQEDSVSESKSRWVT